MTPYAKNYVEERKKHWLFYAAVFFCFLALYAVTAQRGVSWQDSGEFQYRILSGDYHWHSGIARAHPLYIALARGFVALFPKTASFYAANLFSGVGLALALTLLAHSVMRLTRSFRAVMVAVGFLGFAHMAWWMGTIAEVYTWSLACLLAEVLCLVRYSENRSGRWLIALFIVNGLHGSLHNAAWLGLPLYASLLAFEVWQRKGRSAGMACGCALGWLAGSSMVIVQAANLIWATGDFVRVLKSVLFGDGYEGQVLGTAGIQFKVWAANMALAGVSLLNPCWLYAGRGCFTRAGAELKAVRNWLRVLTILHFLFWARYFVPDQATFILPTLGLLAIWVGLGAGEVLKFESSRVLKYRSVNAREFGSAHVQELGGTSARLYVGVWAVGVACAVAGPWLACEVAQRAEVSVSRSRELPYRNDTRYWVIPWKQRETSAARFVAEVGKQLRAGDVLVADSTAAGVLLAAREAGTLPKSWRLVTPWSGEADVELRSLMRDEKQRVFVVSPVAGYAPKGVLESGCLFEPEGILFKSRRGARQE